VSKRLLFAIDKYELIPTTQFGTRAFSSTLDAGLTLMHDVQAAMRRKEKVGILLFDIKGVFDHVKRDRLKGIMENLGFPREYCEWAHSFLSDRKVRLSFNNFTSDEMGQPVGTPQGLTGVPRPLGNIHERAPETTRPLEQFHVGYVRR
jgi:hypothetical protein